jgi:uncharacterized protein YdaU (DUF1376 family)
MSLPYFNLYPTDFEAKTSHLTLEEDGAYNRLLRLCWMTPGCSLPDDDAWIMRRMRVDEATYERVVKPLIGEFFTRKSGRVSNARLTKEHGTSVEKHDKRVSAGKAGGEAKARKTNNSHASNAVAKAYQPEPEPEPLREREPIGSPKKSERGSRLPVDWHLPRDWGQEIVAKGVDETLVRHQADRFKNYWLAKSGKDATKIDWRATWRNWMAKHVEEAELRKGPATAGSDWWGGRDL